MKKRNGFIFLGLLIFIVGTLFLNNALAGSFNFSISAGTYSIAQKTVNGIPQIPVNITWSSDATSCQGMDGLLGLSLGTSGVLSVYPTATTDYSLICTKNGVYSYKSVKIYVTNTVTTTSADCSCYASEANSMSSYICSVETTASGCTLWGMREPGIDAYCGMDGATYVGFCTPPQPSDPPDTEAPILTISWPGNSISKNIGAFREYQYPSNGFPINLAASDNVGVTELKYCDGSYFANCGSFSYGTISNGYATATVNLNYPSRNKIVCFNATDAAGNTAPASCIVLTRVAPAPSDVNVELATPIDGKVYGSFYDNSYEYSGDGSDEHFLVEREVNGNGEWTSVDSYLINPNGATFTQDLVSFIDNNPVCGSLKYRVGVASYGTITGYSDPSSALVYWNSSCAPLCGDGKIDSPEQCDGTNLSSQTCVTKGYSSGTLSCNPSTCQFDFTLCSNPISNLTCSDTDSGLQYNVQGTVTASSGVNGTDFCFNSNNWGIYNATGDYVQEYYCSDNVGTYKYQNCPTGCLYGACYSALPPYCGDGTVQSPNSNGIFEQCDDGNQISTDTCSNSCTLTSCGDGIVQSPNGAGVSEQCDGTSGCNASCQYAPELYWSTDTNFVLPIATKSYANPSIDVATIILSYSGSDLFHIYQRAYLLGSDLLAPDKDLGTYSGTGLSINGDGAGDEYHVFTINETMLTSPNSNGDYEFYFEINGLTSPTLVVSKNLGQCGDGICQVGENSTNCLADCPIDQPSACTQLNINLCSDYVRSTNPESDCNLDLCNVAKQTPPPAGTGQTDKCEWDSSSSQCNKANVVTTSSGASIGSCTSREDPRTDDCSDGFLSYSWSSTWAWANANNFTSEANCEAYSSDCVGKCSLNGALWRCDPYNSVASCQAGSSTIPCPAQVQLSFFEDWRQIVATILVIFVLYVLLMKKKKVSNKRIPSNKKSKKK